MNRLIEEKFLYKLETLSRMEDIEDEHELFYVIDEMKNWFIDVGCVSKDYMQDSCTDIIEALDVFKGCVLSRDFLYFASEKDNTPIEEEEYIDMED